MEKLVHLIVKGFRSIRDLKLELGDLTVLVGANGSGKSNIVEFFELLSYAFSGNLQLYIQRRGGGSSVLHYGQKRTPELVAGLVFIGEMSNSAYTSKLVFAAPDRLVFFNEIIAFRKPEASKPFIRDLVPGQQETHDLGSGQLETGLLSLTEGSSESLRQVSRVFLKRLKGLQVYHFHDTSATAYIRTLQDVDRNHALLSHGGNLASFLYMLRTSYPEHYAQIVATVQLVVPFLKDFVLAPDRLDERRIQLRWTDRNSEYEFGPHQLSDGSLRAIALITALMQPEPLLPSFIILDEPELGLHPGAIRLIGQLIKAASAKRQVLVATQSPRLLSEFEPEDIVVVERGEDREGYGESTCHRLSREELGDWLKDYDLGALFEMNVTGGGPR